MKKKLFILVLLFSLLFSSTNMVFGLDQPEQPEQPTIDELNPEASNESIKQYNQQVDEYNKQVESYNNQVDEDYEKACAEYTEEKNAVEANNEFVNHVEDKISQDSSEARGFTHNTTSQENVPTNWSDTTDEDTLKTIQIEHSNTPTNQIIKVINIHMFLKENNTLDLGVIERDNFELDENLIKNAVLTEWETAEIDYDDMVTVFSEANHFTGNIVWINGVRKWFGPNPTPYFFRSIDGYTQGYWMPSGSMIASTATKTINGFSSIGETYTLQYAEKTVTVGYLFNGQPMTEEIVVRTTDREEPKNIFALFTYIFIRLNDEPETKELPTEPIKESYLDNLPYMDLLDIPTPIKPEPVKPAKPKKDNTTDNIIPTKTITQPTKTINNSPQTADAMSEYILTNLIIMIICITIILLLLLLRLRAKRRGKNG